MQADRSASHPTDSGDGLPPDDTPLFDVSGWFFLKLILCLAVGLPVVWIFFYFNLGVLTVSGFVFGISIFCASGFSRDAPKTHYLDDSKPVIRHLRMLAGYGYPAVVFLPAVLPTEWSARFVESTQFLDHFMPVVEVWRQHFNGPHQAQAVVKIAALKLGVLLWPVALLICGLPKYRMIARGEFTVHAPRKKAMLPALFSSIPVFSLLLLDILLGTAWYLYPSFFNGKTYLIIAAIFFLNGPHTLLASQFALWRATLRREVKFER